MHCCRLSWDLFVKFLSCFWVELCCASADRLLSRGVDRTVKLWSVGDNSSEDNVLVRVYLNDLCKLSWPGYNFCDVCMFTHPKPLSIFPGKTAFKWAPRLIALISIDVKTHDPPASKFNSAVDHHRSDRLFATASDTLQIWDETRYVSILLLPWNSLSQLSADISNQLWMTLFFSL